MYFIGYDIGSSSIKASLLHADLNKEVSSAQSPKKELPMIALQTGWAEQDPAIWWSHLIKATQDLLSSSGIDTNDIKAIGISYQMHGLVMIDKDHKVIRPSIIWCDSRAVGLGTKAEERLGQSYCHQHILNSPGNFTAAKAAWVKNHEPDIYDQCHKIMLPGDYVAMRMSNQSTTTYSGLSEAILYDFMKGGLAEEVLEALGLSADLIPELVSTFGTQSLLSSKAAQELGLKAGTPITYRAGDQPNNALSLNVLQPGELAATAGTSGVIYGVNDTLSSDPLSRVNAFAHVNHTEEQKRVGILLCINGTGIQNAWMKRTTEAPSYESMNAKAREKPIGSDGLLIFPFGNGSERIFENKQLDSSIHGLQFNRHDQGHLYRAAQEGIACSLSYGTEVMRSIGIEPKTIRAGEANLFMSDIFQEAVANLTGASIELYNTDGAQGAARGAGIGLGYYNLKEAFTGLNLRKCIEPDLEKSEAYKELYGRWKEMLLKTLN